MEADFLYKEIFKIKTAIQLLYTPEQWAGLDSVKRSIYSPDFEKTDVS